MFLIWKMNTFTLPLKQKEKEIIINLNQTKFDFNNFKKQFIINLFIN